MDRVVITIRDDKGAIQLRVSKEMAERLRTGEYKRKVCYLYIIRHLDGIY